jgi:TniQ/Tn7-like transposition protein D
MADLLLCFPKPFPDESLYSLAVRYHKLAANPGYRVTSQELFGSYSRTCGSILPCCLGALSERLGGAISVRQLIERFTLLPLYLPFLKDEKGRDAAILMEGNRGTGLKMALGITASRFLQHASFRYCESCVREDILECGLAYWHRIHQASGVCVCPRHSEVLQAMTFPGGSDWRCMLLPGESAGTPVMDCGDHTGAAAIARMQQWGLDHPDEMKTIQAGNLLRKRLDEMGFIRSGRIREQMLRDFLTRRLRCSPSAAEFEEIVRSADWVFQMLRRHGRIVQPLKFYFLCWLLDLGLEHLKPYRLEADICAGVVGRRDKSQHLMQDDDLHARRIAFAKSANLKCHDKPGYQWLYRNDREWLARYVAANPYHRDQRILVDWQSKDSALALQLAKAKTIILSVDGKPQQVTRAALCRGVINGSALLKMPQNFPMSIGLMADLLESTHDHQLRKIRWAIREYSLTENCAMSVLYRYAGIRISRVSDDEVLRQIRDDRD